MYASCVSPLFLGIIAGSAVSAKIDPGATTYLDAYIFSWLNFFSVAVGLFTVSVCGFLASIYLIGETDNKKDTKRFITKAKTTNIAAGVAGTLVFIAARVDGVPLPEWLFGNPVGIAAIAAATASLVLLWYLVYKGKRYIIRVLAGFQVTMILLAITYKHFPNIVLLKNGQYLSLTQGSAPDKSIHSLAMALLIGSIFILPALFYLVYDFQHKKIKV